MSSRGQQERQRTQHLPAVINRPQPHRTGFPRRLGAKTQLCKTCARVAMKKPGCSRRRHRAACVAGAAGNQGRRSDHASSAEVAKGALSRSMLQPHEPLLKQTSLYSNSLTRGKGSGCQIRHGRLHLVLMKQGGSCPAETLLQLACCSCSHDEAEPSKHCRVLKTQQRHAEARLLKGQMWSATDALLQRQLAITLKEE